MTLLVFFLHKKVGSLLFPALFLGSVRSPHMKDLPVLLTQIRLVHLPADPLSFPIAAAGVLLSGIVLLVHPPRFPAQDNLNYQAVDGASGTELSSVVSSLSSGLQ